MKKPAAKADNDFQKSPDDVKAYVAKHKLEQTPDLSSFKQFFTNTNISQLWVELQRHRDKATDMGVSEAWTAICKMKGSPKKAKLLCLLDKVMFGDGCWQSILQTYVESISFKESDLREEELLTRGN